MAGLARAERVFKIKMMQKIVPLHAETFEELESLLKKVGSRADGIEIWLDELAQIPLWEEYLCEKMKDWRKMLGEKTWILGVCKNNPERIKILQKFLQDGGDFIDLDINQNTPDDVKLFNPEKLFLSFHDYENLPENLEEVLEQMQKFNPNIYKFAITPHSEEEIEKFLAFINNFPEDRKAIFTTMGALGSVGRIMISHTGKNWAGFFALDPEHKTASGQQILASK